MASRYDERMEEIARMRAAERAAEEDSEGLHRIEESTETINRGMANPIVWLLGIGAIVGIPFSGGLSIGLAVVALLLMTGGGKAYVQAIPPTPADVVAPVAGCKRILFASLSLVIFAVIVLLFLVVVYYNATGGK